MTRGKLIFRFAGFNRQMTPNDKEEKLILLLVRNVSTGHHSYATRAVKCTQQNRFWTN